MCERLESPRYPTKWDPISTVLRAATRIVTRYMVNVVVVLV